MIKIFFLFFVNTFSFHLDNSEYFLKKIEHASKILGEDFTEEMNIIKCFYLIQHNRFEMKHIIYVLQYPIHILVFRKVLEERILMMKDGKDKTFLILKLLSNYEKYKTKAVTVRFQHMVIMMFLRKQNFILNHFQHKIASKYLEGILYHRVGVPQKVLKQLNSLYTLNLEKRFIFLLSKNNLSKAEETACISNNPELIGTIKNILFLKKKYYKTNVFHSLESLHWFLFTNLEDGNLSIIPDVILNHQFLLKTRDRKYIPLKKSILKILYKIFGYLIVNDYKKIEELLFSDWVYLDEEPVHILYYMRGLYEFYRGNYLKSLEHFQQALAQHKNIKDRAKYLFWIGNTLMMLGAHNEAKVTYRKTANLYIPYYSTVSSLITKQKIPMRSIHQLKVDVKKNKQDWYWHVLKIFSDDNCHFNFFISLVNSLHLDNLLEVTEITIDTLIYMENLDNHGYITVLSNKIRAQTGLIIKEGYLIINFLNKFPVNLRLLIYSILRKESYGRYTNKLSSYKNAKGVMQIREKTAKALCKRFNIHYSVKRLLEDNEYNITIGEKCLEELLKIFNSNIFFAIAAYNAGSPQVLKWVNKLFKNKNKQDIIQCFLFTEFIPIGQTRDYVKDVLDNFSIVTQIQENN